jgi:transcription antitermination factor NusG
MDGGSILEFPKRDIRQGMRWYVFEAALGAEIREVTAELRALGFETLVPVYYERVRGPKRTRIWKAFPAYRLYAFVAFDYARGDWASIARTKGVRHVMRAAGSDLPSPVPQWMMAKVIEDQKKRDERHVLTLQSGVRKLRARAFKEGEAVKVPVGSKLFFEAKGTVLGDGSAERVKILLSSLGDEEVSMVVEMAASEVEAA